MSLYDILRGKTKAQEVEDQRLADPCFLIRLYSNNPRILIRCAAAYHNIPYNSKAFKELNVTETSRLAEPIRRMLNTFAEALQEELTRPNQEHNP